MATKSRINMLEGSLWKNSILYTLPIIATGVLQLLFNTADLLVVGWFCSPLSVGAIGSTGSITSLIVNLFMGLSVGAGVTVAQRIGAGDGKAVGRAVHTAFPIALVCGTALSVIGVSCARLFLEWMGNPIETIGLATTYMRIYFLGMISNLVYNFGAAILRAAGDTVRPLIFLTVAGVLNVGLNILFVLGFGMDVDGVAWATIISQTVSAALVVIALARRDDDCQFKIKKMRFHKLAVRQILFVGLPAGIQSSMFAIGNVLIQSSINSFGAAAVTGCAAAGTIEGYVYVGMNAFSHTAMNFTGQNMGAGNIKRIRKILGACMLSVVVVGAVLGAVVYGFHETLLGLFVGDYAKAIEFGRNRLFWVCLPYFVCGMQEVMTGVLRGMGFSVNAMVISVVGVCGVRILWIYSIFKVFPTPAVLFAVYIISWLFVLVAGLIFFFFKHHKMIKQKNPVG